MVVKYFNDPFYHTIVYDFFNEEEIKLINDEILLLHSGRELIDSFYDEHHNKLQKEGKVETYKLDIIYENKRYQSSILNMIQKVYILDREGVFDKKKNPFLNFIADSNFDNTMLHGYKSGSSYFEHNDKSVLSFLYPFYEEPKLFSGGDLMFNDYVPELEPNCCIIFPSYEKHKVSVLQSKTKGILRWSINQRIFIRN